MRQKECKKCGAHIPCKIKVDGKTHSLQRRKYCIVCSPLGSRNTRKLEIPPLTPLQKKENDGKKYKKWQQKTRILRKEKLVNLLGGKCQKCGYKTCMAALEFHHDGEGVENKKYSLANRGMLANWDELVNEAKKCILLCANCHREAHHPNRT